MPKLKNRIKEKRLSMIPPLNQTALAKKMGVDHSTICKWERNVINIADENKVKLCQILKCDLSDLFYIE